MKYFTIIFSFLLAASCAQGQYIDSVYSYTPAPGQYINTSWGNDVSAETLVGGLEGKISLGAFGGKVIFSFENPVENHPDNPFGVDFSIFGNSNTGWSEPSIVYVMKDINNNEKPDDIWYELAGSDHYFSSTTLDYEVSYVNPNASADIPWTDNQGNSGIINANEFHTQAYYPSSEFFPLIDQVSYILNGTRIAASIDKDKPEGITSYERTFGYADNHPKGSAPFLLPDNPYTKTLENGGGDAFDISWAIAEDGTYLDLDEIDFIKVQNATMEQSGTLGYLSSEILGAIDISPGEAEAFSSEIIVIKDIPKQIADKPLQLEAFAFNNGRLIREANITWTSDQAQANITTDGLISDLEAGALLITATYDGTETISQTISTTIVPGLGNTPMQAHKITIYPNPASSYLYIESATSGTYSLLDTKGVILCSGILNKGREQLDVNKYPAGLYILRFEENHQFSHHKILLTK